MTLHQIRQVLLGDLELLRGLLHYADALIERGAHLDAVREPITDALGQIAAIRTQLAEDGSVDADPWDSGRGP